MKFDQNRTINVENMDRNSFQPFNKVWLSLLRFSRNSPMLNGIK